LVTKLLERLKIGGKLGGRLLLHATENNVTSHYLKICSCTEGGLIEISRWRVVLKAKFVKVKVILKYKYFPQGWR